jgi:hypothetical protein
MEYAQAVLSILSESSTCIIYRKENGCPMVHLYNNSVGPCSRTTSRNIRSHSGNLTGEKRKRKTAVGVGSTQLLFGLQVGSGEHAEPPICSCSAK